MNAHARMSFNILPVMVFGGGFSRIINPDFIVRHILYHRMNTPMVKIIELGLAEIKKVDDFGDFGARVRRV